MPGRLAGSCKDTYDSLGAHSKFALTYGVSRYFHHLSGASIMNATGTPMGFGSGLALIVIGCLLAAGGGYVSALMAAQRANSQHLTEAHATASNTVAEPG
jgi:hypothetical protein